MHGLEREYEGRIDFVRANIHQPETRALQEYYGFTVTPEFFLVDGEGRILGHWDDQVTLPLLRSAFDQALDHADAAAQ